MATAPKPMQPARRGRAKAPRPRLSPVAGAGRVPVRKRLLDPRLLGMVAGCLVVLVVVALIVGSGTPDAPDAPVAAQVAAPAATPAPAAGPEAIEPEFGPDAEPAPEVVVAIPTPGTPTEEAGPLRPEPDDPRLAQFAKDLFLVGPPASRDANIQLYHDTLYLAIDSGRWDLLRAQMRRAMELAVKQVALRTGVDRFNALRAEPLFMRALSVDGFLRLASDGFLKKLTDSSPEHEFYQWLLHNHPTALEEFLLALTGNEDMERSLATWASLWMTEPANELREKYRGLALACALVFQGSAYADEPNKAGERYRLFRDNAEKGRLTGKIHRMPATDLVWVVDVPVPDSEIEWALENMHLPQRGWGAAYSMIEYLMERAVGAKPDDPANPTARDKRLAKEANPYEAYTFEEILKHGGICQDQAYFSAYTAKCHGIPAAILTGDGDNGPHAWILWMPDEDTWQEAGGMGYATGTTRNPQTGQTMHQSTLTLTTDERTGQDRLEKTRMFLRFMDLFQALGQRQIAGEALDLAMRNTPKHPLPWQRTIAFNEDPASKTTLKDWEAMADTLRRRFKERPDFMEMAEQIEDKHIFPQRDAKENSMDIARERRRLARDNDGRADLIAQSVERQADLLVAAGKTDDIDSLYHRSFQQYGDQSTTFGRLADQYFAYASKDPKWAEKACREIELSFKRNVDTGTDDYFRCMTELGLLRKIAGYYESSGDSKRAELLRERADKREKTARRGAL